MIEFSVDPADDLIGPPVPIPIAAGYIKPAEIIAHIEAWNVANNTPWRQIAYAADLAYLEANDRITAPAIYVVPGDEKSRDASDSKVIRQIISCSIQVVSIVRHYRISDFGQAGNEELAPLRQQVRDHLIGFKPVGFKNTLRHSAGKLVRYTDEFMVYVDEFNVDYSFQKYLS
jgi:hypothetical protein